MNDKKNNNDTDIIATIIFHIGIVFFIILPVVALVL